MADVGTAVSHGIENDTNALQEKPPLLRSLLPDENNVAEVVNANSSEVGLGRVVTILTDGLDVEVLSRISTTFQRLVDRD